MKQSITRLRPLLFVFLAVSLAPGVAFADDKPEAKDAAKDLPAAASKEIDYARDIEPILTTYCVKCHGPQKQKSELRLDSREAALKGGDTGPAIVPGKSAESRLIRVVAGIDPDIEKMPQSKTESLTPEQIGLLRAWIDQGVKWPEKVVAPPRPKDWLALEGQKSWVTSVAYAPDGKSLATGGGHTLVFKPGEAKLWDLTAAASGKEKTGFGGHTSTVWSVAFDKEGNRLATASYDKLAKVWSVADGKELLTLKGHSNWVTCVAFSPRGNLIATGSEDTTVKLWDAASGAEKATLKGHAGTVRSVAFSKNGDLLASASFDGTIKLWDVEKGAETATLKGHEGAVWSVDFDPESKRLASGGADGTVRIWSIPDGAEKANLKGHKNWVSCVAFSADGKQLASGGFDRRVILWDLVRGAEGSDLDGLSSTVWSVSFSPNGKRLAIASGQIEGEEGTARLWNLPVSF